MSIRINIKGKKFGKLTVIEHIGRQDWKCVCECGTIKIVKSSNLRSCKPIKSCGGECRLPNRIGQKFNELLVLEEVGRSKQGTRLWKCQCSCGKIVNVRNSHLTRGQKSCGCLFLVDLTGQKFGFLTVLKKDAKKSKNRSAFWKCLCDCGKEIVVNSRSLVDEMTKSYGCLRRINQYETIKKTAFGIHKASAKKRGYRSDLILEQYIEIACHSCIYCNKFSKRKNIDTGAEIELNSVDRRDNEPYYTLENCQSVCFNCQQMKMDMTDKEFRNQIEAIHKNLNK